MVNGAELTNPKLELLWGEFLNAIPKQCYPSGHPWGQSVSSQVAEPLDDSPFLEMVPHETSYHRFLE